MILPDPPLLVISDRRAASARLSDIASAAFVGGCRWFSLREKDLAPDARRAHLAEILAIGRRFGALVSIHDDIEAAAAEGAGGIHLPGGSNPAAARARLPSALLGVSAHSTEEAQRLLHAGADYVTLSPVFLSASKPGYGPPLGPAGLAAGIAAAGGPVVALGGITAANAAACVAAGAAGIAVIGAVMSAADPCRAVKDLLAAIAE